MMICSELTIRSYDFFPKLFLLMVIVPMLWIPRGRNKILFRAKYKETK